MSVNETGAKPVATPADAHHAEHTQHAKQGAAKAGAATVKSGTVSAFVPNVVTHHQAQTHRTAQAAKPSEGNMWAVRQSVDSLHARVVDPATPFEQRKHYRTQAREEYQHYLSLATRRFGANSEEVKEARATVKAWAQSQNTALSELQKAGTISESEYKQLTYPEAPAPVVKHAAPVKHAPSRAH